MASHASAAPSPAATATATAGPAARPRTLAIWLLAVAALVFAMVVVGGITRLTESGLSIVRWDVVAGTLPPLSEADWQAQFAAYRATSQYQMMNAGMSLAAFKGIFFWEYVHRLLARLIGVAFALPLAWFWWRRAIPSGYKPRLLALLALGGLQGAIGWWMVASGLVDRASVAPERLAVHLVTALTIMAGCIWTALDLRRGAAIGAGGEYAGAAAARPRAWVLPFALLLTVQIVWGAFTAGLRAGHVTAEWPTMFGSLFPAGLLETARAVIDDPAAVVLLHRSIAWAVAAAAVAIAVTCWRRGAGVRALALGGMVVVQFVLGVLTVINGVPILLGVAHQAGAALLVAATVWLAHWAIRYAGTTSENPGKA